MKTIIRKRCAQALLALLPVAVSSQTISLHFPRFAGKAYSFTLFQGDRQLVVATDTIPPDGRFRLVVPKAYAPYTGMCRWLITNSSEGGGLDMIVPGHDFGVSCLGEKPNATNIVYENNEEAVELSRLYRRQAGIIARYQAMAQAKLVFAKTEVSYPVFEKECARQSGAFDAFQDSLRSNPSYAASYMQMVNAEEGIGSKVEGQPQYEKAQGMTRLMAEKMDWNRVYTSGRWSQLVYSWMTCEIQVLRDPSVFASDFDRIGGKLADKEMYADFASRVAYFLTQQGKDGLVGIIAPTVLSSGKISRYDGVLKVFKNGAEGSQGADLVISAAKPSEWGNTAAVTLKAREFAAGGYRNTVLFFYESGCMGCEMVIKDLLPRYDSLKVAGVRVIAVSADADEESFKGRSKEFPWPDSFCDYTGMDGVNFRNYGVAGTPTLFLLDSESKILVRTASLDALLEKMRELEVGSQGK